MGRRQFAKDPTTVRHFKLVARSQNDRFADDPDAPPLVLEPYAPPGAARRTGLSEAELMQVPQSLEESVGPEVFGQVDPDRDDFTRPAASSRREEDFDPDDLDGDCYFPRDGYNYEQHLKKMSGGKDGGVVGVVIEAKDKVPKEEIAMQPAVNDDEKEVLQALDNAEEFEEIEDETLEDIFGEVAERQDIMLWGPTAAEDEDLPDLALFKAMRAQAEANGEFEDEDEEGPQASRRTVNDEDFDQFMADEYGEDAIGACDEEEIEGNVSLDKCEAVLDEYIHFKTQETAKLYSISEPYKGTKDNVPRVIEETKAIIEKHYSMEEEDEDTSSGEDSEGESRTWDCETVLSTLSNLSNRPGKIGRIKVVKKPAPALKSVKEDEEDEKEEDDGDAEEDIVELPDVITTRPRGETPEERRARKASVKEMRRVCRKMKKESKDMYKSEAAKLPVHTGPDVRGKTKCFKL